ncbi:ABC transporter substrate-binding protein [Halobacteriales archaeon QH_7_69_31]|nr:MAG: ABC transporter substrate-binding protein [Halobacteriales archaeon QH_7_69_31]
MVNNGRIRCVGDGSVRSRVARRSFLRATGAGATGVALAGCLGDSDGGDGSVPDTITVGSLGPSDSPLGASIHNSAELAVEEINADGGIAGADVEVSTKDTKDQPSTARDVYKELTTGEDVEATVGIFGSEQLLAIMDDIAQAETVHLTSGAATPEAPALLAEDYEKYRPWFRVGPTNSTFLDDSLVTFASERFDAMGWETVAFIAEDFKWTEPVTDGISQRLSDEANVEVTQVRRVSEGTEDFTPIFEEIENNGVDGVYTALAHIGTTPLVQWAKQQRPFGFGGIHVPTQLPSYYAATEGAAIATFSNTTATPTSEITDKTVPYANAYNEAYDGYPVYSGYSTYDAVYMFKNAVEAAESVATDDVIAELEAASHTGTSGTLEFYGRDQEFPHDVKYGPDLAQGVYFQWQPDEEGNGQQRVIWPDDLQESDYISPPWA